MKRRFLASMLLALLAAIPASAEPKRKKPTASGGKFDYYLLVLSFAPDFCDQPTGNKDPRECGPGRKIGFIVHGLWPQNETSRGPENCGSSPVAPSVIQATLSYIPSESLIQHEWKAHGSCTGMTAADYFSTLRRARDSVKIPPDLDQPSQKVQLSPAEVESKMASANPTFPASAFRTSCYRGNQELQEVRICVTKDLSPRACTQSAGECTLPNVTLLPVK